MRKMDTKTNQEDVTMGEYVETINNTPQTSSIVNMKTEDVDQDKSFPPSQIILNQNVKFDNISCLSKE